MSLDKYRRKRDFTHTREPAGKPGPQAASDEGRSYVVQKHDASHLHYDFRLELGGVLLSWAVPKGPSLDPSIKRLAVQTEDHPVEYGGFEGTIPEGQYGGGTVMVWDRGTWQAEGDAQEAYEKGHLKFELHGERLLGGWHLVRTERGGERQKTWLLFKAKDDAARAGDESIVDRKATSVLSGLDMEAIAGGPAPSPKNEKKGKARSHAEAKPRAKAKTAAKAPKAPSLKSKSKPAPRPRTSSKVAKRANDSKAGRTGQSKAGVERPRGAAPNRAAPNRSSALTEGVEGSRKAAIPDTIEPQLATLVSSTPSGDDFVHEVKFDGYRVLARIDHGKVTLFTRNGEDWTRRMGVLAESLAQVAVESAVIDGEFVALNEHGLSDFQLLQNSFSGKASAPLAYYAFDLPYLDGFDLRAAPLIERKRLLSALFSDMPESLKTVLRYSEHVLGEGARFFAEATKLGLEGVVSKRAHSPYQSGRGKDWQKSKGLGRQEFVIVGFTEPSGSRSHLGALLLGARKQAELVYSGRVGTGFNERSLEDLHTRLTPLELGSLRELELVNAPRGADARGVHWVRPTLVAEVAFTGVTSDGLLRHPIFKGLREDKPAAAVVVEVPEERPETARRMQPSPSKRKTADASASQAFSHPDKVLYPELGITKAELGDYYAAISELMLPHVVGRPITLLRCPEGRAKACFFQKHPGKTLGEGLTRVRVPSSDGSSEYAAVEDARGLQSVVQMGGLELHVWGALASDADRPDLLVFDLDPGPGVEFSAVVTAALEMRELLHEHDLKSWVKTTGGKGLHVTVPIIPEHEWDAAKDVCRAFAEVLAARDPDRYVANMSKAKRVGKIFIDYFRNGRSATFIAPYSSRAREGAGVAMPVEWSELDGKFKPELFNVRSAAKLIAKRKRDPFASLLEHQQRLPTKSPAR